MSVTAKITSKGQITLPKEVRKILDVNVGNVVVFEREDDKIIIKPAKTLKEYKGFLKGKGRVSDFDEIRKKAKEYVGKKVAHGGRP
ncbi:MAG: AbrB/MazE/SpoVT family DNA-binding domain-containing protein [Nitrospirota bacterium]|jgi:AbrB family looped-hinge helix DNA binding protein